MDSKNFRRMRQLIDEVFATQDDPNQLDIDEKVRQQILRIHPATFSEFSVKDGPVAWVLVIPTTLELMNGFIHQKINEKQLVDQTLPGGRYEAIYLCSASVLEEYRRQGLTLKLALESIEKIRLDHPIEALFVWPFSDEGDSASETIAQKAGLPLFKRGKKIE